MNKHQAIDLLIQSAVMGQKAGVFSLEEAELVSQAVKLMRIQLANELTTNQNKKEAEGIPFPILNGQSDETQGEKGTKEIY